MLEAVISGFWFTLSKLVQIEKQIKKERAVEREGCGGDMCMEIVTDG